MPINGQIYELRCVGDTKLALTITGASNTNGAAAILWASNGYQCQRFKAIQDGTTWYLVAQHNNKVLSSPQDPAAGDGVGQWTYTANQTWCQWEITTVKASSASDAPVVEGVACESVTIKRTETDLYIDASDALAGTSPNATLQPEGVSQEFALYRVMAYWSAAPTPYELGAANEVGGTPYAVAGVGSVYISYKVSKHYTCTMRYRKRTQDAMGAWGDWDNWTAWADQTTNQSGGYYWTSAIPCSYDIATARKMELQVQLCQSVLYQGVTYYGNAANIVVTVLVKPTTSIDAALMTPEGLMVTTATDYTPTTLTLTKVGSWTGQYDIEAGTTVTLPSSMGVYADGDEVEFSYWVGTDLLSRYAGLVTETVEVSADGGEFDHFVSFDNLGIATITGGTGYIVYDGKTFKGNRLPAPYNRWFDVWIVKEGVGVWHGIYGPLDMEPCHVLFGDEVIALTHSKGKAPTESFSVSADTETVALDGAEWPHVAIGTTKDGSIPVDGILIDAYDDVMPEQIRALAGKRCIYRGPYGVMERVVVSKASAKQQGPIIEVSLDLVVTT